MISALSPTCYLKFYLGITANCCSFLPRTVQSLSRIQFVRLINSAANILHGACPNYRNFSNQTRESQSAFCMLSFKSNLSVITNDAAIVPGIQCPRNLPCESAANSMLRCARKLRTLRYSAWPIQVTPKDTSSYIYYDAKMAVIQELLGSKKMTLQRTVTIDPNTVANIAPLNGNGDGVAGITVSVS